MFHPMKRSDGGQRIIIYTDGVAQLIALRLATCGDDCGVAVPANTVHLNRNTIILASKV